MAKFVALFFFKSNNVDEVKLVVHFFEKICRVVSHIGYDLIVQIEDI